MKDHVFNIYIPETPAEIVVKKELFILTRPFWNGNTWLNDEEQYKRWGVATDCKYVSDIKQAHIVFIPMPLNYYFNNRQQNQLKELNDACLSVGIKAYGYIAGDFGIAYPEFSNIIYFRMGGFRKQLLNCNKGFPVAIDDYYAHSEWNKREIAKSGKPLIGFCGHASLSFYKRLRENSTFLKENLFRFLRNPFRKDWEVLFGSSYHRARLLEAFEKSPDAITNFIYRDQYRAGAKSEADKAKTTLEYFRNIAESDYILCVRGGGNFSVRFYETLMMGKIPVFINTDCLLPFVNEIDWRKHVVWVEWSDRKNVVQRVIDFHKSLSSDDFSQLQLRNRELWENTLSVNGIISILRSTVDHSTLR